MSIQCDLACLAFFFSPTSPPVTNVLRPLFFSILIVTQQEFTAFFQQFGKILDSVVMVNKETGRPKGFGFVVFKDPKVCRRLLAMRQHGGPNPLLSGSSSNEGYLKMFDKQVIVKSCEPKTVENVSFPSLSTMASDKDKYNAPWQRHHQRPNVVSYGPTYDKAPPFIPNNIPLRKHSVIPPRPCPPMSQLHSKAPENSIRPPPGSLAPETLYYLYNKAYGTAFRESVLRPVAPGIPVRNAGRSW